MTEILKALLFGIVEGITEWLPVSSTGHMILLNEFVKLNVTEDFWNVFLVVIQLGAILAVVLIFFRKLWPFHRIDPDASGAWKILSEDKAKLWCKILISCVPAILIGLPLDDWLDAHFYNFPVVAAMLIVYGVLFLLVERYNRGKRPSIRSIASIGYREALIIGIFQVLALIPGTSRSGATILGALLIGVSRKTAGRYTFYLAVPVMLGASLLKLVKHGFHFTSAEAAILLTGMAAAFVISLFVIRFFLNYIRKHDFKPFGWYRIALGAVLLIVFAVRTLAAA